MVLVDIYLVKVLVDIIDYFNQIYVVVIGVDDLFGRNVVWFFINEVKNKNGLFFVVLIDFIFYNV